MLGLGVKIGATKKALEYFELVKETLGASILGYYPCWEPAGPTAADVGPQAKNAAYNGSYSLGVSGIGDGKTGVSFDGTTTGLNIYNLSPINMNEGFIALWVKLNSASYYDDANNYFSVGLTIDSTHYIRVQKLNTNCTFQILRYDGTNLVTSQFALPKSARWIHIALVWSVSAQKMWFYINGVKSIPKSGTMLTLSNNLSSNSATIGTLSTGTYSSYWKGKVCHVVVGTGIPSDSQIRTIAQCDRFYAFDGDSRTSSGKQWAARALEDAFPSGIKACGGYGVSNFSVSGRTSAGIITAAPTGIDTLLPFPGRKTLIVWIGVNSVSSGANQIYTDIQTYVAARRAAGWDKIIVCSEIDAQLDMNWHNTVWPALNTLLRNNNSFADAFADLGADARLQDATNTTYYNVDKIHLTNTGYDIVGGIVAPVIASLG